MLPAKNPSKKPKPTKKKKKVKTIVTVSKMFKNFHCNNPVAIFCSLEVQYPPALFSRYFSFRNSFVHLCFLKCVSLCKTTVYKQRGNRV